MESKTEVEQRGSCEIVRLSFVLINASMVAVSTTKNRSLVKYDYVKKLHGCCRNISFSSYLMWRCFITKRLNCYGCKGKGMAVWNFRVVVSWKRLGPISSYDNVWCTAGQVGLLSFLANLNTTNLRATTPAYYFLTHFGTPSWYSKYQKCLYQI